MCIPWWNQWQVNHHRHNIQSISIMIMWIFNKGEVKAFPLSAEWQDRRANDFTTLETNCGERRKQTRWGGCCRRTATSVPAAGLSLLHMRVKRPAKFPPQYMTRVPHNLNQAGGCGHKLYQLCYNISNSSRAGPGRFPRQHCNWSIQTIGRRSVHMWFHLGRVLSSPQVASLFTFIKY